MHLIARFGRIWESSWESFWGSILRHSRSRKLPFLDKQFNHCSLQCCNAPVLQKLRESKMLLSVLVCFSAFCSFATAFQYKCTSGVNFGGVQQLCSHTSCWASIFCTETPINNCHDGSDSKYCSNDWVFQGCFSYEGSNILRIVPCDKCICYLKNSMSCLPNANGNPRCKVCLTSSSQPETARNCGKQFEDSEDFKALLGDTTKTVNQKKQIYNHGTWKCRNNEGSVVHCGKSGTEYFLHSFDSIYQCPKNYWKPARVNKCVRKLYADGKTCEMKHELCGQRCSPLTEPCNRECRNGWVKCSQDSNTCYPSSDRCCSSAEDFYCDSNSSCESHSNKKLCSDGSCKEHHETCYTCSEDQVYCTDTNECAERTACPIKDNSTLSVTQY